MRVLVVTTWYPTPTTTESGIFVLSRVPWIHTGRPVRVIHNSVPSPATLEARRSSTEPLRLVAADGLIPRKGPGIALRTIESRPAAYGRVYDEALALGGTATRSPNR